MNKHTPGPWTTYPEECDRPYIRVRGTQLGARFKVANVLTPVYEGVHIREVQETRANALLIAAAPELLNAVKFLLSNPDNKISKADRNAAYAAIAKATGEET